MTPYDYDVIVIGAGPAGLSAAIRLRWVKGFHAIPMSVCLVDPEPPGGLAALGGCVLTGPAWATNATGIVGPLLKDVEALQIPHIRERARAVTPNNTRGMLTVQLASGKQLTAHAIIVATGFRGLHGEAEVFGRGLYITYKGYSYFAELFVAAAKEAAGRGLVVIGHEATLGLLPLLAPVAKDAGGITLLLRSDPRASTDLPPGVHVQRGYTTGYLGEKQLTGVRYTTTVEASEQTSPAEKVLNCGAVVVDYHAFEKTPERWGDRSIPRRDDGFVVVDAHMATPTLGVFAAGDVTGRFASTAMALGDGVCAGFSAYTYVFKRKFGIDPSLYAYAATGPAPASFANPALKLRPFDLPAAGIIRPLTQETSQAGADSPDSMLAQALETSQRLTVDDFRTLMGSDSIADKVLFKGMFRRRIVVHHCP